MFNKAILIGRLTADPELKQTQSGASVVSFSIAVDRSYAPKGGERQTDFIDCVAWRANAEFISKYFAKGRLIGIEGSIQARSYEDKNGNKRKAVEVVVDNAFFTESKSSATSMSTQQAPVQNHVSPQPAQSYSSGSAEDFQEIDTEDDLPF
ncbi:MAG: single-stranded DNA-binding protein [Oscillospiraceae bacterium]